MWDRVLDTRTHLLNNEGFLPYDVNQWINQVRKKRNDSAHENLADEQDALMVLRFAHRIAVWFMLVYGDSSFSSDSFMVPERPKIVPDYTRLVLNQEKKIAEQNALLEEREKLLAEQKAQIEQLTKEREANRITTPQANRSKQDRLNTSAAAISNVKLTEAETRKLIDEQLRKVGWEVDTATLRYSNRIGYLVSGFTKGIKYSYCPAWMVQPRKFACKI